MNTLIISDIDGTIIDQSKAVERYAARLITETEFNNELASAPEITKVTSWLRSAGAHGCTIRYLTARSEHRPTRQRLRDLNLPDGDVTFLGTSTPAVDKAEHVGAWATGYDRVIFLDDNPDTCATVGLLVPGVEVIQIPGWSFGVDPDYTTLNLPDTTINTTTTRPQPTGNRKVLLYSGGVDSYCAAVIENPDVLLHINTAGAYGSEQFNRLQTPPGMEDRLVVVNMPELAAFEMPQSAFILPARNAIFALIGAQYGSTVQMGSIAACRGSDKDEGFAQRMTELMSYIWQPQDLWNVNGRRTTLQLPVMHLTKRELVEHAVKCGAKGEDIRDRTFSCYTPKDGSECGQCVPCGKKWAALVGAGIAPTVDAREAFAPYYAEVERWAPDVPPHRTEQHVRDVRKAWNSEW